MWCLADACCVEFEACVLSLKAVLQAVLSLKHVVC